MYVPSVIFFLCYFWSQSEIIKIAESPPFGEDTEEAPETIFEYA